DARRSLQFPSRYPLEAPPRRSRCPRRPAKQTSHRGRRDRSRHLMPRFAHRSPTSPLAVRLLEATPPTARGSPWASRRATQSRAASTACPRRPSRESQSFALRPLRVQPSAGSFEAALLRVRGVTPSRPLEPPRVPPAALRIAPSPLALSR